MNSFFKKLTYDGWVQNLSAFVTCSAEVQPSFDRSVFQQSQQWQWRARTKPWGNTWGQTWWSWQWEWKGTPQSFQTCEDSQSEDCRPRSERCFLVSTLYFWWCVFAEFILSQFCYTFLVMPTFGHPFTSFLRRWLRQALWSLNVKVTCIGGQ